MRSTKKVLWAFLFLLLIITTPLFAYGDKEAPPRSYAISSPNNKFIFVMIAPNAFELVSFYSDETKQEAKRVREKYSKSGMYLNDGSTTPLWTVDWYSRSVLIASDGVHLIRRGPWALKSSNEAFTFFANGKAVRSYKIRDLVKSIKDLHHTVSHFSWEAPDSMKLDEDKHTLSVSTLNNEHYIFDYRTGKRLSKTIN